jgi:hypothetical protein
MEKQKNITVGEIITNLNKLVEPLNGKKINHFGIDLHESVENLIGDYCNELGIVFVAWHLRSTDQYLNINEKDSNLNYSNLFV